MSNQYIYSGDQAIIIQDGAIIWNDQSHEQSSLNYFDANDSVINDSTINESYVTAIDSNETQYLSILEHSDSNEITLEGLHNLTVENGDVSGVIHGNNIPPSLTAETVEENNEDGDSAQVIVFTIDGSDDLYGIQLTHDEAGNVQKYQFKFRPTSDGQLEPIPETVTLLPNDSQIAVDTPQVKNGQSEETERSHDQEYFLVQTSLNSDNCIGENVQNHGQVDGAHVEHVYIKECHSPVVAEGTVETENVDAEILQHCIDTVAQDTHLERHLKNMCIKTELIESAEQDIESPMSSQFNIKQEKYFGTESEEGHEDDIFDDTIQNDSICKEDLINIQQQQEENYPDNEIQIYQQSDEASSEPPEESQGEEFLASEEDQRNHEQLLQHFINENSQIEVQYETELEAPERPLDGCEYNEVYHGEEHHTDYAGDYLQQTIESVNDATENGQYHISEGYIGGPVEAQEAPVVTTSTDLVQSYQEPMVQRSSILKRSLANSEKDEKARKPLVSVKYYVVYPEKENFNSLAGDNTAHTQLPIPKLTRSNPRSVLRTSFLRQKEKRQKLATNVLPECDLYHKRFAKNKDAMRAKHFHNFLNRTTIPHAPVRQQRQPRKQEIKPVIERSDEEIIVQEVIVSSTGFIESINKKVRNKKVQVTAVVELSDSEDDSNVKLKRNRRKTHHLLRNPSESDISIIEIHSDNDEPVIPKKNETSVKINNFKKTKIRSSPVALKRRRGRPPKIKKDCFELSLPDVELSPSKRNRTDPETVVPQCDNIVSITSAANIDRKEITCPFCPKTFPSQNSLNTHIIHHNLENSLKKKAKMSSRPNLVARQSLLPKLEYNHKCDECQESFKNIILLQKHNCTKKQTSLNCSVCLKQFRDVTLLNIHKKSHAKSNLVKNTTILKISPKKILHRPSTSLMKSSIAKSPKKLVTRSFKCTECPKVCDSEEKLTTHTKMHKKFLCSSCFLTFSSKILLDTHIRTNCVKLKAGNKRLSFSIKKSFLHTPPRRLSISKPREKGLNNTMNQSILSVKLDCDQCSMKFSTFRNLYTHKVQKHGLNTPDKSLMTKPKQGIYKPRAAHGGIPANDRLKKAYAALRKKLAETEDLII